ncbi:hypothetical protein MMC06_000042 [Schaereria dolodes]|nr:hypothetical protein [Schaereria dolodes]
MNNPREPPSSRMPDTSSPPLTPSRPSLSRASTEPTSRVGLMTPSRKLRESCDACHLAKVKCTKTRTDCARCVASGIKCAYSPSARTGKPRGAKDRHNRSESSSVDETRQSTAMQGIQQPEEVPQTSESYHMLPPSYNNIDPLFLQNWGNGISSALWQCLAEERPFLPSPLSSPTNIMPPSCNFTQADWSDAVTPTAHPSILADDVIPAPKSSPTSMIFPHSSPQEHLEHQQDDTNIFKPVTGVPDGKPITCNCFSSNLQSLQTLRRNSSIPASQNATPFDIALSTSKEAISHCTAMLSCVHCMRTPAGDSSSTPVLVLAGLMDDILTSYSAACTAHFDAESDSLSSMTSNEFNSSSQLTLGTYLVDGEDGRYLKLEILMIELRKVERLWVLFKEMCAQVKAEDAQKGLCEALVSYLAQTLQRTVKMLEARRSIPNRR